MANCVCWVCKRPMDCTGETLCDLSEIDSLSGVWLSDCCDSPVDGELRVVNSEAKSGWCGKCYDYTLFSKLNDT